MTKNETWSWFKSFFSEESGGSTTRLLNWVWTFTLCASLLFLIGYGTIKTKEAKLPEIPTAYITLTGLFLAAKVGQRVFGENTETKTVVQKGDTTTTTETPTPPNPAG
jgi:hypothetical membrane protein